MRFSYNWLCDYIRGKMPSANQLAEYLMFHSFEVEKVERYKKDFVLDISILPNRAHDCLGHFGIGREISAILNLPLRKPTTQFQSDKKIIIKKLLRVDVEDVSDCPRYAAIYIQGVKVKNSPIWMQERLKACGLQPINNIVDITNYVMLELNQPLHAFDMDRLGRQIVVRRALPGESIKTLDKEKKDIVLDSDILVIADLNKPVAIAGIKGGAETGITESTKNVIIEAANFNPVLIRRASQKLKIRTDASWRFENGLDPNIIDQALDRVAFLIQKLAGGKVANGKIDFYPQKVNSRKILFPLNKVEKILGLKIPKNKIINILKRLDLVVQEKNQSELIIQVPTFRLDIKVAEDFVEEVGRIYGYEKIEPVSPLVALSASSRNDIFHWAKKTRNIFKEMGWCEVYNRSFIGETDKEIFNWPDESLIALKNPLSALHKYLRPSLFFGLLNNVKENLKNFDGVCFFELGNIFQRVPFSKKHSASFQEKTMLSGVLSKKGLKTIDGFLDLKGMIEELLNNLGIKDVWYDEIGKTPDLSISQLWNPYQSAEIKAGQTEIGFLGVFDYTLLEKLDLPAPVLMFEIDFEKLTQLASEENEYEPISPYPPAFRDLAVLVPQGTKTATVLNIIYTVGGKLVKDVDLFDVYTGEAIEEGKENLAFHITYQDEKKTLSAAEIDKIHRKIIAEIEKNPLWEVRK